MINSNLRMLNIIDNTEAYLNDESKEILHLEQFDIRNFIRYIIHIFEVEIKKKKLRCDYTIDDNVPVYIKSSPKKLKQILISLIQNSLQFT